MRKVISWKNNILTIFLTVLVIAILSIPSLKEEKARVRPDGWTYLLPNDQIRGLALQGKHLWIGGRDGLNCLTWKDLSTVSLPAGSPDILMIEALLVDASDTLWVAHDYGLHALSRGKWENLTANLPDSKVLSVISSRDGAIWVGTWAGVARRTSNGWEKIVVSESGKKASQADRVRILFEDSRGGIWVGTSTAPEGGLFHLDHGAWGFYSTSSILAHNTISAMFEDKSHHIWIGTGYFDAGGLTFFPNWASDSIDGAKIFKQPEGLAGNKCRSIFQDSDGVFWFGSELDGLARWSGESRQTITVADGLPGNEVMTMLQDPEENLWLGTDQGLVRIGSSSLKNWTIVKK